MKIRVKYCGGCNPRYGRKETVAKLRADFPRAEVIEGAADGPFDYVVVVAGCTAACASHEDLHGKYGKDVLMAETDYDRVAEALRAVSP